MSKKHFIRLAQYIQECAKFGDPMTDEQIDHLARFCREMNPRFNKARWVGYIRGHNGPNGGKV